MRYPCCLCACMCILPIVTRQRHGKHDPAATNTLVGGFFFNAVRVISRENRRLVLARVIYQFAAQKWVEECVCVWMRLAAKNKNINSMHPADGQTNLISI
jgi:hypothetical protein